MLSLSTYSVWETVSWLLFHEYKMYTLIISMNSRGMTRRCSSWQYFNFAQGFFSGRYQIKMVRWWKIHASLNYKNVWMTISKSASNRSNLWNIIYDKGSSLRLFDWHIFLTRRQINAERDFRQIFFSANSKNKMNIFTFLLAFSATGENLGDWKSY